MSVQLYVLKKETLFCYRMKIFSTLKSEDKLNGPIEHHFEQEKSVFF